MSRLGAVLLAAGGARRMGAVKQLARVGGQPLVTRAAQAALAAGLSPVVAVTGNRAEEVEAALPPGLAAVRNSAWAEGMTTSLAAGIAALPADIDGAFVLLADMPRLGAAHLRRLAAAFVPGAICVPVKDGRRGNPVLFARDFFGEILALSGDHGAKAVIAAHAERVIEVAFDDEAIFIDVDTQEDLRMEDIRAQFPALGPGFHYLDNAAMAQVPSAVTVAMAAFEAGGRANVHRGLHGAAGRADTAYGDARASVARFLSADAGEVVFTPGCTAALNLAARALGAGLRAGDGILVTRLEHHANLLPWLALAEEKRLELSYLPVTADGRLDLGALPALLTERIRVVAVTMASNVTGAVTDLPAIAALAHRVGAVVVADAAQLAPHGPVAAAASGADLMALSGHKCYGPTGIGVLWGRRALLERLPPVIVGGGMVASLTDTAFTPLPPPARFEAGTPPVAQAVGLGAALEWMMGLDWPAVRDRERALVARLREGLARHDGIRVAGPADIPVVSFSVAGCHPHDVAQILDNHGVAVRAGHHCARPLAEALGLESGSVRASLAPYSDESDIDALLAGVAEAVRVLR